MNTRYIMKKRGFGLLCLLGIMGLSSCTNESEEQTLGGDLLMELTAQVNQVKTRASSENSWVGDGTEQISLNVRRKEGDFQSYGGRRHIGTDKLKRTNYFGLCL